MRVDDVTYPLTITTMYGRNERKCRGRILGKFMLLSAFLGGMLIVSLNDVFAYVPSRGVRLNARSIRRIYPAQTKTAASSSNTAPERPNQMNITNNDSNIDAHGKDRVQQNLSSNKNTYSSGKFFFHERGKFDGLRNRQSDEIYNLQERLLIDEINRCDTVNNHNTPSIKPELKEANSISPRGSFGSVELKLMENQRMQSTFYPESEVSHFEKGFRMSNSRSFTLRRIQPLRTFKRILGRVSTEWCNKNSTLQIESIRTNNNDAEIKKHMNVSDIIDEYNSDNSLNTKKPSLRQLWRKRHARTLEDGIRRERRNTLSFLMNKAIVNARPSQERSYVERSLMGLINGLAEEVEDLDIELNTISKTPFWRKEVEEIRINFSRLGFRPLQLGGTNTMVEIFEFGNDNTQIGADLKGGPNALVTNSSRSKQGGAKSGGTDLSFVECADEGFDRIDEDGSGTLDKNELAQALNSISGLKTNKESIVELASDLVRLYDDNGDGVVDREEYQQMVEDMAKLRDVKGKEWETDKKNPFIVVKDSIQSVSEGISSKAGEVVSAARDKYFSEKNQEDEYETEMGSIVLSKMNLDLRRLVFGALPLVKKITPGGPLILEPFTATVTASFSREDVMGSFLLDAALRRLVARALRVRVRSYRDLVEGALFVGRRWKMTCKTAPVVEVLELSNVEFDSRDKMIITGRARIRADPDAPIVTSTFKVRTKIGTRKNGQVIKLKEPELAFVFECPKAFEKGLAATCKTFGLPPPRRPEPYYSFFPIYSPFKVDDDTGGFDMGEDNCIRSIYIRNGKLRFEMSVVLRPGRFLGNHYLAFTVPQRTFIITMDRVWNGVRAARENKQVADRVKKMKKVEKVMEKEVSERFSVNSNVSVTPSEPRKSTTKSIVNKPLDLKNKTSTSRWHFFKTIKENTPKPKSFYTRFVDGYTMIEREEEANNERITNDISDWFGRQGRADDAIFTSTPSGEPREVERESQSW